MSPRKKKPASSASPSTPRDAPRTARKTPLPASPLSEPALAAIVRSQEGQPSAEGFWKSAGRFTKLR